MHYDLCKLSCWNPCKWLISIFRNTQVERLALNVIRSLLMAQINVFYWLNIETKLRGKAKVSHSFWCFLFNKRIIWKRTLEWSSLIEDKMTGSAAIYPLLKNFSSLNITWKGMVPVTTRLPKLPYKVGKPHVIKLKCFVNSNKYSTSILSSIIAKHGVFHEGPTFGVDYFYAAWGKDYSHLCEKS